MFGDFEDLETGEVYHAGDAADQKTDNGSGDDDGQAAEDSEKELEKMEERLEKKKQLKTAFDVQYPLMCKVFEARSITAECLRGNLG